MAAVATVGTVEANKVLLCRYFAELDGSSGSPAVLDEFYTSDCTVHFAGVGALDIQGMKGLVAAFYGAFPDLEHQIESQVAEGDLAAARLTVRGTHRGEFRGVPATGKRVEFSGMVLQRIAGGRIAEYWVNADVAGLMQQLTNA